MFLVLLGIIQILILIYTDSNALLNVLKLQHYDAIINCAECNIDNCDKDPYKGWLINTAPLIVLSNWSKKFKIPLLKFQ